MTLMMESSMPNLQFASNGRLYRVGSIWQRGRRAPSCASSIAMPIAQHGDSVLELTPFLHDILEVA